MNEQELKQHLLNIVQEFASKRNEAENYVREHDKLQDASRPTFKTDEEKWKWFKENPQTNWFDEFSKLLSPLIDIYCTDKRRVYGGKNGYSFGFPVQYNGIENPVETSVEIKNKNRAEVYIKTDTNFKDEYLFVLLRKKDEWKIDNYKGRRYGNTKWDNKIL